jgi:Patatin-like phospholipase
MATPLDFKESSLEKNLTPAPSNNKQETADKSDEKPPKFEQLFRDEDALLCPGEPRTRRNETLKSLRTESPGPAGEPWISYTPLDRVGLAFSGGGIRSATFNLGVLKALQDLHVLKDVDYLSTVSGGGYIGAWWTAWRARGGTGFPDTPIDNATKAKAENREPEEVRHLREFSNFLSPRIGFFQTEMWSAVMAVVSAILPALLVASTIIALGILGWLGFTSLILADGLNMPIPAPHWAASILKKFPFAELTYLKGWLAPVALLLLLLVVHVVGERQWRRFGKAEPLSWSKPEDAAFRSVLLIIVSIGIIVGWTWLSHWQRVDVQPVVTKSLWKWAAGILPAEDCAFSPYLFAAPILLIGIALILLVPRLLLMRFAPVRKSSRFVSATDRGLSRLLATALIFGAFALLWLVGCWLNSTQWGTKIPTGGALISGGAFALLRNWIGRMGPVKKGGIMDILKPLVPQILAYIAIALWAICIAALLAGWIERGIFGIPGNLNTPLFLLGAGIIIVLFAIFCFDPAQVSMHSFYRNRLCRAYLGASNLDAKGSSENNRQTDVRVRDDIELRKLSPKGAERPIHLVCCAANDLAGDHLENLSRGSRSAVLSKFGFSIGNYWHAWEDKGETLGLASAITASAAAFNSNMGSLSMTLGAGVTFLCTALNLRLGLWLGHPLSDDVGVPKWTPGLLFLKEMIGATNSGLRPPPPDSPRQPVAEYVHLSDGAHFENLALYELIRRHCRYIVVSDCGADPQVAFDDFGNAVRRIREDFGVEIEIDLSPLKPDATRISKQHVAVGSISYTRGDQKDTGILIYLKPTLTGDEPCDITQYRTRNEDFPHESTGDQFYDEAQWESYRRLGEHAARSALRFVERERQGSDLSADEIFNGARWEWYQSLARLQEKFVEFTGRFTALITELREKAPKKFVREMFPELQTIAADSGLDVATTPEETTSVLHFLLQIIQLMEDVWVGCDFETHWNDPNNLGWMNAFQRWAYTPSFRLWWPIVKPLYGSKFRRFIEERLSLADEDYPPTTATVNKHQTGVPDGVALVYWKRMHERDPNREKGKTVYSFDLKLTLQRPQDKDAEYEIQAGLAFLDLSRRPTDLSQRRTAHWTNEEFFVPPSLWGAGLGARFLDKLLIELKKEKFDRCEVTVEPPERTADHKLVFEWLKRTDLASRQQRADLLAFYQRAGFILDADKKLVRKLDDIVVPDAAPASGSGS